MDIPAVSSLLNRAIQQITATADSLQREPLFAWTILVSAGLTLGSIAFSRFLTLFRKLRYERIVPAHLAHILQPSTQEGINPMHVLSRAGGDEPCTRLT